MDVRWGDRDGEACLWLTGCAGDPASSPAGTRDLPVVRVFPSELTDSHDQLPALPPMAGHVGADARGIWFAPRFGFVAGISYTVFVQPGSDRRGWSEGQMTVLTIVRPADPRSPTTTVTGIYPSGSSIPFNQLRLYLHFSAPMSEGGAAGRVHVVDDPGGHQLADALLPQEPELWDGQRRRLTLLFDPARLKRGLVPHEQAGYPLRPGRAIRVVIDRECSDAAGQPLRQAFEYRYRIGPDVREHVNPSRWKLTPPGPGTVAPLVVDFDRPLDHGLLLRCLAVTGGRGQPVPGSIAVGPEERSWAFLPVSPWPAGHHHLVVEPRLEDLAGNSLTRVFDRDLQRPQDDPRPDGAARLPFVIGV